MYSMCVLLMYIRTRFNYGSVVLDERGNSSANTRTTIGALLKNGELLFRRFGGCIEAREPEMKFVKLTEIISVNFSDDEMNNWEDVPFEHYVVGVYMNDCFYVALFDNAIKSHPYTPQKKPSTKNNVISLFDRRLDN